MTYEQAYYYKMMLEIGISEEFDAMLDKRLTEEDPLEDLTLDLSTCGGDRNNQIHILNEYLLDAPQEKIDCQKIFDLVVDKFREIYEKDPEQVEQITKWMHDVTPFGWWNEERWSDMYEMNECYDYVVEGIVAKENFMKSFLTLLYQKKASLYKKKAVRPVANRHGSLWKRIKHFFGRQRSGDK